MPVRLEKTFSRPIKGMIAESASPEIPETPEARAVEEAEGKKVSFLRHTHNGTVKAAVVSLRGSEM